MQDGELDVGGIRRHLDGEVDGVVHFLIGAVFFAELVLGDAAQVGVELQEFGDAWERLFVSKGFLFFCFSLCFSVFSVFSISISISL